MKKFILLLVLVVCSVSAFSQAEAGRSSFGFNIGYGFDSKNATLGLDYRYCITDEVRLSPSLTYLVKNNGISAAAIDLNVHYVFNLGYNLAFYPLVGLDLSFWKFGYGELKLNKTRFGGNVGLGAEVYATDQLAIGLEAKYNIIKDWDQAMIAVRVAYCF